MRVCSLFCGIGGIDLAFIKAKHEIVWANDIDTYACRTYRHNFPDIPLVEGDIRSIDKKDIPDFDILTAGFPCQPFSVCGKQKGFSDERGNLFFEIGKVIDEKHPSVVFLENVANLTEHDKGKTFNVIHNELAGREYFFATWLPTLAITAFRNIEQELISSRLPIETLAKGSLFPKKFHLKSI